MYSTPILLITFNRPNHVRRVLESIRAQQPQQLFVFQDGARVDVPADTDKCAAVRQVISDMVDWSCQLQTYFSDKNLGCGPGPATAITWFFENVEQGIILEDDCLPADSFYRYCEEMLNYYKADMNVGIISGFNPLGKWKSDKQSYHFSKDGTTWGWATWCNRWERFDFEAETWPSEMSRRCIVKHFRNKRVYTTWFYYFDTFCTNARPDVWDYQWSYARFCNGYMAIMPAMNQIHNIGFGADSTHTFGENSDLARRESYVLHFPILHPKHVRADALYDFLAFNKFVTRTKNTLYRRIINKILQFLYVR